MSERTWWSRRFVQVLEALGMGYGLDRGRRDARAGTVLSMSLSTSVVVGQVQSGIDTTYRTRIGVKALSVHEWSLVEAALAESSLYTAKLLAGELPPEIEKVFADLDLQLFPTTLRELSMDCTCPNWEMPCRHLAAVCAVLADSFDTDPFQILAWRGRTRTELLARIRSLRKEEEPSDGPSLAESLDTFWTMPTEPVTRASRPAGNPDALLDQLDPLPITLRGHDVVDLLRPAYRQMGLF